MTFRETFYNVKQLMVNRLIDFGLEDADIDLGWTTLLTLAQNTRITIDVPLDLTYSDDFTITGTLETATYRRLSYQILILEMDGNEIARTETDIDGTYSFTTTPTSMGNHSFQVIFEGTNIYRESESSIINRMTEKETSVINVQATPTAHINGSTIITGTLKSDDAELIKEVTIKLDTPSGTTLTETTNQYGQFNFTITNIPSFNGVYADCYFEGDNYYAESSIRIPIPVYQETLTFTSDKDILSYADEEYATLSAQYKDTGDMNLGSGKQIDIYQIYEVDDINLSSDKDILSYVDNEYATITAQLTKNNKDVKVSGIPITFSRPICDFDETDVGTGLNKHLGDSYSFTSDGIIKIGDNTNYIEFDYERGLYNTYGTYAGILGDSLFENDVVSLENGSLCINGVALIDITDYPLLDFTTLYAYTTSGDSSNLYIEDVLGEVDTDSSGVATIRYDSQGTDDVTIKAICGLSNEIYIEDLFKEYALDGSEAIFTMTGSDGPSCRTPTIENNILKDGSGYLANGWNNTIDWQLTFDYFCTGVGNGAIIIIPETNSRNRNSIMFWQQENVIFGNSSSLYSFNSVSMPYNNWHNIKVIKENNTITVYVNNNQITTDSTWNGLNSDTLCIGLDQMSSQTKYQAMIKNIKIKLL